MEKICVPLSTLTTMKVGGPVRILADVVSVKDVLRVLERAHAEHLPVAILGAGSNTLADDTGFPGIVLRSRDERIEFDDEHGQVIVGSGTLWDALVTLCVERGYIGFENLSGIPGTVGAAPIQNIGAYGKEVGEMIRWVEVFDLHKRCVVRFEAKECAFTYRESVFKRHPEFFILRVAFALTRHGEIDIAYRDLAQWFTEHPDAMPTPQTVREAVLAIRSAKFPDLKTHGTAGSFFKNPIVSVSVAAALLKKFPEMPRYPAGEGTVKLSAAWLIDKVAGMRGARVGDVGSWHAQALVLVNYGKATSKEVSMFAERIVAAVEDASGVVLEREVVPLRAIDIA